MPVPTGPVSLSSIQTEFGGGNPISLSEYYRGGGTGYVPSAQTTSATDGVAISTSGLIRVGMFRGLTKYVAAGVVPSQASRWDIGITASPPPATAYAYVIFQSEGYTSYITGAGPNWHMSPNGGVGAGFWIRATVTYDNGLEVFSGPAGWTNLGTNRLFSISATSDNSEISALRTVTFEFATDSAGSNVVGTFTGVQFAANVLF